MMCANYEAVTNILMNTALLRMLVEWSARYYWRQTVSPTNSRASADPNEPSWPVLIFTTTAPGTVTALNPCQLGTTRW